VRHAVAFAEAVEVVGAAVGAPDAELLPDPLGDEYRLLNHP
jgi:hypothetical protein